MEGLTAVTFGTPAFWLVLGILLAVTFPAVSAGVSLPGDWGFAGHSMSPGLALM